MVIRTVFDVNVLKDRLAHWFRFDHLLPDYGIALLIGMEPYDAYVDTMVLWGKDHKFDIQTLNEGIPFLNGNEISGQRRGGAKILESFYKPANFEPVDYALALEYAIDRFRSPAHQYCRMVEYWNSGKHPEYTPLSYFVDWARSKNLNPYWEHVAVEFGFITGEILGNGGKQPETAPHYSTAWLNIQQAAIVHFFNPRRNPDAKRDEIIAWVNLQAVNAGLDESINIASTIFTIIKPANHDPKKKRVEPKQIQ